MPVFPLTGLSVKGEKLKGNKKSREDFVGGFSVGEMSLEDKMPARVYSMYSNLTHYFQGWV